MKVLMVHYYQGFHGGAEEVVVQLDKYLRKQGVEVRLVMEHNPIELYKDVRGNLGWCDIVNIHNFPATLTTFPICNRPQVWICNEPPELFTSWWKKIPEALSRWWVRKSDMKVVVASKFDKDRFEEIYKRRADYIIPYGVDYEFWGKKIFSKGGYGFRVLQVGCICRYKNQLGSIKAFKEVKKVIPNAKLILAGPGVSAERDYYEEVLREAGKDKDIILTGQLNHEQLRQLYQTCDVLVHPIEPQGGWLCVFEALSTGLPIVVSTKFAGSDILRNAHLGIVTDNIVEGILRMYREGWDMDRCSNWVKENMTWDHFGSKMFEVFKGVIQNGRRDYPRRGLKVS